MFIKSSTGAATTWSGDPSDQAAHDWVLRWLQRLHLAFAAVPVTNPVKGNLGESICYAIGYSEDFAGLTGFAPNALSPFREISRADIDLVWISINEAADEAHAVLQEVKTTSATDASIADDLVDEYARLFDLEPQFTLHTRLQAIANEMEFARAKPKHHADLVRMLASITPAGTDGVSLLPSLVFDSAKTGGVAMKMAAVRQAVMAQGWSPNAVSTWAVGLGNLDGRFSRLRAGRV